MHPFLFINIPIGIKTKRWPFAHPPRWARAGGLALLLALLAPAAHGQALLQGYVEQAQQNGWQVRVQQQELAAAQYGVQAAKAAYLPQLSFGASYTRARGGRTIDIPVGDLFNPVYAALNDLSGTQAYPTNLENVSEQFFPNDFHDTRLRLVQPLFNQNIGFGRQAATAGQQAAQAGLSTQTLEAATNLKVSYYNYLKTQAALAQLDSTQLLLQELSRVSQRLQAAGRGQQDAVYRTRFELNNLTGQRASLNQQANALRYQCNVLMGRQPDAPLETDAYFMQQAPTPNALAGTELTAQALEQRPELQQLEAARQVAYWQGKVAGSYRVPTLSLVADAGFQGFGYTFDNQQDYVLLQVQLELPLYTGGRNKANAAKAQAQTQAATLQQQAVAAQVEQQVLSAQWGFKAAQQQLQAATSGLQNAKETFRRVQKRYANGQASLVEYLDAQTLYTQARTTRVNTLLDCWIAQATLQRALAQ